jgi:sulfite exporter TauE/SafE
LDLSEGFTWIVPFSVLSASLLSSPHCVLMCGPLAANFASGDKVSDKRLWSYQLGRGVSYTLLGLLAGAFGREILSLFQAPAAAATGLLLIGASLLVLGWRSWKGEGFQIRPPALVRRFGGNLLKQLRFAKLPPNLTAGISGLFTVFLPCGHLYAFALGAMAMGSPVGGAAFMLAFWLGTVPALGFGVRWAMQVLWPRLGNKKKWAGAVLIVAGLFSLGAFAARVPDLRKTPSQNASDAQQETTEAHKGFRCH